MAAQTNAGRSGIPSDYVALMIGGQEEPTLDGEIAVHAPPDAVVGDRVLGVRHGKDRNAAFAGVITWAPKPSKRRRHASSSRRHTRKPTKRKVAVARLFGPSAPLHEPLGRARTRTAFPSEIKLFASEGRGSRSRGDRAFLLKAASQLAATPSATSTEERAAFLMREAAVAQGYQCEVEVALPAEAVAEAKRRSDRKADAVLLLRPRPGRTRARILVIEYEWSSAGGAESAAQAYEYAATIKAGPPAVELFGLLPAKLRAAEVFGLVVAKDPRPSRTGAMLNIKSEGYNALLARLASDDGFDDLEPIRTP